MPEQWKLIDAKGLILGRMCSHVVKLSEVGQHIVIINGKDAIVSGAKNNINEHYQHYKNIKTRTNPKHGPFRVGSRPDIFVKKVMGGMMPKNERGKLCESRVHVYIADIPEEKAAQYGTPEKIVLSSKFQASTLNHNKMTVEEICLYVGWNKGGME
jgi:large subunit ribosomal protein L13